MRTSALFALATASLATAHTTVQEILVNGKSQGQHTGIRTPANGNNPIKDVTSADMMCNAGGSKAAPDTISVASGDKITFQWHHNDPATAGDGDEPIAASHKGPILVYIAPAASNGAGDVWVKIYEDGLTNGVWAVDKFIQDKGQHSLTLPNLPAGDYILRPELIALHEAFNVGGAQLYMECVQIKVTSSGTASLPAGVAFPGAYSATDPGITVNIYPAPATYTIPGPKLWDGASSGSGSGSGSAPVSSSAPAATSATPATPTTLVTAVKPAPTTGASGAVAKYGQCGGQGFTGATACASGSTCQFQNDWYSQCL